MQPEKAMSVLSLCPLTEIRATSRRSLLPWKAAEEGGSHAVSQVMPQQGRQRSLDGVGPPHGAQASFSVAGTGGCRSRPGP